MLPDKIRKKIKEIEIEADKLSSSVLIGKHLSVFKGMGIDFSDLAEYKPGDEIRNIAWRQSAKSGHTYIKKYVEERDLNIMLFLDISLSGNFGSGEKFNAEAAAEFAATIAMSAKKSGDRVGIVLFSDEIELFIPPAKTPSHILRIIREILYFRPKSRETSIEKAFSRISVILPKHSQIFLITDIWSDLKVPVLKVVSQKHDLNVITLYDDLEKELKDMGNLELSDLESTDNIVVNTSSVNFRKKYKREMNKKFEARKEFLTSIGARNVFINNKTNIFLEIIKFYSAKKKR